MKQIVTGFLYSTPEVSTELDIGPSLETRAWLVAARVLADGDCDSMMMALRFRMVLGAKSPEDAVRQHAMQIKRDGGALPREWQVHPLKTSGPLDIGQFFAWNDRSSDNEDAESEWDAFHDGFVIVRL